MKLENLGGLFVVILFLAGLILLIVKVLAQIVQVWKG
jgi:hypothetical protein